MSDEGTFIRNVTNILIPGEEVVFSVYQGSSGCGPSCWTTSRPR
jgi:hypothetical protein